MAWALLAIKEPTDLAQHLIAASMAIGIVDGFEIVEIDEEQRDWTHRAKGLGAPLDKGLLKMGVIVQTGEAVPRRLVT